MRKMILAMGFVAMLSLPSCMHPAEQAFEVRAANRACLVDAEGRISQGACDTWGRFTADRVAGLTLLSTPKGSSGLATNDDVPPQ
jgi:hypothetical protein